MEEVDPPQLALVKQKLEERRGDWQRIADDSGVPYHTLTKIAQGVVQDPRIRTVQKLADYFGGLTSAA